ncbi:MAG: ABC transporter permease, partial [Burkholderiales bacterium]
VEITLPAGAEVAAMRARGDFASLRVEGIEPLAREVLPRTLAGVFALPALAALSGLVAMILSYFMTYGATPWAFEPFTRVIGQIFEPAVALIFVLKTLGFSFAVSLIPMAAAAIERPSGQSATDLALQNLVRMTLMILLIEAASLAGNYT